MAVPSETCGSEEVVAFGWPLKLRRWVIRKAMTKQGRTWKTSVKGKVDYVGGWGRNSSSSDYSAPEKQLKRDSDCSHTECL